MTYKVLLLGDPKVGKTAFADQAVGRRLSETYQHTASLGITTKRLHDRTSLQLLEIPASSPSQPEKQLFDGTNALLFFVDPNDPTSFGAAKEWNDIVKNEKTIKHEEVKKYIVCTKMDIIKAGRTATLDADLGRLKKEIGAEMVFKCSSKGSTLQYTSESGDTIKSNDFNPIFEMIAGTFTPPEKHDKREEGDDADPPSDSPTDLLRDNETFTIFLLGNGDTGKSAFRDRWCNRTFSNKYAPTWGFSFQEKTHDYCGQTIKFRVLDFSGNPTGKNAIEHSPCHPDIVIFFADPRYLDSVDALKEWNTALTQGPTRQATPQKYIILSKSDLRKETPTVEKNKSRAKAIMDEIGAKDIFECSSKGGTITYTSESGEAKTEHNFNPLFDTIIGNILRDRKEKKKEMPEREKPTTTDKTGKTKVTYPNSYYRLTSIIRKAHKPRRRPAKPAEPPSSSPPKSPREKVLLVGGNCGKTQFLNRVRGKTFEERHTPTDGLDRHRKEIDGRPFWLWELGSVKSSSSHPPPDLSNTKAALFFVDPTNDDSFKVAKNYNDQLEENVAATKNGDPDSSPAEHTSHGNVQKYILCTKYDMLPAGTERELERKLDDLKNEIGARLVFKYSAKEDADRTKSVKLLDAVVRDAERELERMIPLLDDYVRPKSAVKWTCGLANHSQKLARLLSGHWKRNHIKTVSKLANTLREPTDELKKNPEKLKALLDDTLKSVEHKKPGSCAKRLNFIRKKIIGETPKSKSVMAP